MPLPREWIGFALVLAALARAALLIAHEPVVGYGNQYDMLRTSACIGLYPALDESSRYLATPQAPQPVYRPGPRRPDLCDPTTEVFVDGAVAKAARLLGIDAGGIRLEWLGYAKLGLLAAAALVIAIALHGTPFAALVHGIVLLAVMADPAVTLWFNTLYTEFGTVWGAYVSIGAICALALTLRGGIVLTELLALGLIALAFSRAQFALLPPFLVLAAGPWLWRRSPHAAAAAFGVALVAAVVSYGLVPRPADASAADRADAYHGLAAPSTAESKEALARAAAKVLPATQAVVPAYLGVVAGAKNAQVGDLPPWLASPLAVVHDRLPAQAYASLILAVFLAAPLGLLAAAGWARPGRGAPAVGSLLAMLLGGTALYCFLTTVFGVGYSEPARHFLVGHLCAWTAWLALIAGIPELLGRWLRAPRERAAEIAAAVVGVALCAFAVVEAIGWAREQPVEPGSPGSTAAPTSSVAAPTSR